MSGTANGRSPRSMALVGPYGAGKSALFDALMEAAGSPVKRPADPRNRPSTTELRLGHCQYLGDNWSILDCPGSIEFAHEVAAALTVVDLAVVVCEPAPTRALAVSPLLKQLTDLGVPHLVFVNKAAHDKYQEHPRHLKFIEENKENWEKVRVFDSYLSPAPPAPPAE